MLIHVAFLGLGATELLITNGTRPRPVDVVQIFGVFRGKSHIARLAGKLLDALVNALDVDVETGGTGEALGAKGTGEHRVPVLVHGQDGLARSATDGSFRGR